MVCCVLLPRFPSNNQHGNKLRLFNVLVLLFHLNIDITRQILFIIKILRLMGPGMELFD